MAAITEQEEQKIKVPEIRDYADDYADGYAVAEAPYEGESEEATADSRDSSSIDVDVDDMVWEVETEPADTEAEDENGDAYSRDMREAYDSGNTDNTDTNSSDTYDAGTADEEYYDGRPYEYEQVPYSRRMNKHIYTWLLSVAGGVYGLDRFARGQIGLGLLKLMTFGGMGLWYLADAGVAIYKSYMSSDSADSDNLYFDRYGRFV